MLLSYKFDLEVPVDTAKGCIPVSNSFKMWPVHFLRIATSVTILHERKSPPHQPNLVVLTYQLDIVVLHYNIHWICNYYPVFTVFGSPRGRRR
jgi:hypothetical protein